MTALRFHTQGGADILNLRLGVTDDETDTTDKTDETKRNVRGDGRGRAESELLMPNPLVCSTSILQQGLQQSDRARDG